MSVDRVWMKGNTKKKRLLCKENIMTVYKDFFTMKSTSDQPLCFNAIFTAKIRQVALIQVSQRHLCSCGCVE